MRKIATIPLLLFVAVGCASRPPSFGGGNSPPTANVEMSIVRFDEKLDSQPVPKTLAHVVIVFPLQMRRAGIAGDVLASATVEADGTVSAVVIDHVSHSEFIDPVLIGLGKCVFFPAKLRGVPVRTVAQCKIRFMLIDD